MNALLQQAQEMQKKMATVQEELQHKTVESTSGGGMVRVVINGKREVRSLIIDPAIVDVNDIEMLQDLITLAVNEAQRKAKAMEEEAMAGITGGFSLPGLF